MIRPSSFLFRAALVLVVWTIWLAWLWQPARQVRLHTASLLGAVQHRNWGKFEHLLADEYSDRWGHDKTFVIGGVREVFQQFIFLNIDHRVVSESLNDGTGIYIAQIRIAGQGGPVGQFVIERVNGLSAPFTFVWKKSGGAPWDWALVRVEQPQLEFDGAGAQF